MKNVNKDQLESGNLTADYINSSQITPYYLEFLVLRLIRNSD
jgi:hypothetical protein